jgi:hypothetical protein
MGMKVNEFSSGYDFWVSKLPLSDSPNAGGGRGEAEKVALSRAGLGKGLGRSKGSEFGDFVLSRDILSDLSGNTKMLGEVDILGGGEEFGKGGGGGESDCSRGFIMVLFPSISGMKASGGPTSMNELLSGRGGGGMNPIPSCCCWEAGKLVA